MAQRRKIVFDVETAAKDLADFDEDTRKILEERLKKEAANETEEAFELAKGRLAFSPLTAEVVAIAMMDVDTKRGAVFFRGKTEKTFEEGGIKFESGDEKTILKKFWDAAVFYDEFITFAGRMFDVPVLMIRSAILGIRPTKNLMTNRYASLQPSNALHIDLQDQFSFYGAKTEKLGLHFWCSAFGIASPKTKGITGNDVTPLFRKGEYEKIARYCLDDVVATCELFLHWENFLRF